MTVTRILDCLEQNTATGNAANSAAQQGILEWAFANPDASPKAASAALSEPAAQNARSDAALAFVRYLRQATQVISAPRRRRRPRIH